MIGPRHPMCPLPELLTSALFMEDDDTSLEVDHSWTLDGLRMARILPTDNHITPGPRLNATFTTAQQLAEQANQSTNNLRRFGTETISRIPRCVRQVHLRTPTPTTPVGPCHRPQTRLRAQTMQGVPTLTIGTRRVRHLLRRPPSKRLHSPIEISHGQSFLLH